MILPLMLALTLPVAAPVATQTGGVASAVTLNGACERMVVLDDDATSKCGGAVINTTYDNGRSNFAFTVQGLGMVAFSGPGTNQTRDGDQVRQPLDRVMLLRDGAEPAMSAGAGSCAFGNPYSGRTTIACSIETGGKRTEVRFVSDGATPNTQQF